MRRLRYSHLLLVVIFILACNAPTPTPVPPTTTPSPTVTASPTATPSPTAYFTVAVIVDTKSEPVSRAQAESLISDASLIFSRLTPFGFQLVDYTEDNAGGSTNSMANRYIAAHPDSLPNGLVILSYGDSGQAKLYGGYSGFVAAPAGFRNTFVSPTIGSSKIYIGVIHYSHKYAACGYNGTDTVQSPVSVDGECRNQPGVACVQHNGYSMCENAVNNLYASTPTYFAATSVIHEFLHSFSDAGNMDHYATPECNSHMGRPAGYFVFEEAELYNGMCPDVYDNFVDSYQP